MSTRPKWQPNLEGVPYCVDCADVPDPGVYYYANNCWQCGKLVRHSKWHAQGEVNCFCSMRCKDIVETRRRLKKEREQRKQRRDCGMICASCSRLFVPKRGDAVTCSSPCRQRMYRLRALQIKVERRSAIGAYP
jgi:hypothetical protein